MSRCVSIVNDELELRCTIGQGWNGFHIWSGEESTILALNYMFNKAFDTQTHMRIVDEYYGTSENWSDPDYVDPDAKIWGYKDTSNAEMQAYMDERSKS